MKVTFLGTSGAFPTATRNATSHVVQVKGETLLLDCGEGAQQQLRRTAHHFQVDKILLSHMHLDHILGLPGYIWTQDLLNRVTPLSILVPQGTAPFVAQFIGPLEKLSFPLELVELADNTVVEANGYRIRAAGVTHHAGPCLGFRVEEHARPGKVDVAKAAALGIPSGPLIGSLVSGEAVVWQGRLVRPEEVVGPKRPGRVVAYSGDTRPCDAFTLLAQGADLVIHEAMFVRALSSEALHRGHSTSTEAAQVALRAQAKCLALTHISQRHQDSDGMQTLLDEAQEFFKDCFIPADLDSVSIALEG